MPNTNVDSYRDLQPGLVYVTLGTIEQVKWLFRSQYVKYKLLTHPTTKDIRRQLDEVGALAELFSTQTDVVIILPRELEGTGYHKAPRRKPRTQKNDDSVRMSYKLPNDQYFKIGPSTYCFVICADILGQISDETKQKAKKLVGNIYELLDLRNLDYGSDTIKKGEPFPLTSERKGFSVSETHLGDPSYPYETHLIKTLGEKEGVKVWSNLTQKEIFKLFLIPGFSRYPILCYTDTWGLDSWLEPFVCWMSTHDYLDNAGIILGEFALWVYCATRYWATDRCKGLYSYKPPRPIGRKQKILDERYGFVASEKARIEWLKTTTRLGLPEL